MTDVPVSLPAKRKRGRPRKDGNIFRQGSLQSPEHLTLVKAQRMEGTTPTPDGTEKAQLFSKGGTVDGMVGRMINGVIEGSFDAGYFISVRIGNDYTPFRGVIFQPGKFIPITAANDVAPQAKMHQRRDIPVPVNDCLSQISGINSQPEKVTPQPVQASNQAVLCPILPSMALSVTPYTLGNHSTFTAPETIMLRTSSCSNMGGTTTLPKCPMVGINKQSPSVHPTGCLRMVEQDDEVMEAFEVSTSSRGCNAATLGDTISESSFRATTSSFFGKENINQKPQVHEKTVESGPGLSFLAHSRPKSSDVEPHQNSMNGMPQSEIGVQQNEMVYFEMEHPRNFVHDGQQSPIVELQEPPAVAQVHSVPGEPEATKTELQPSNVYYNGLRSADANLQYLSRNQSQPGPQEPKSLESKFHPAGFVSGVSKSPNLKLDLSSTIHEKKPLQPEPQDSQRTCVETNYMVLNELKNPNLGYHQALVAGNPLLLPPNLMGMPPEFIMEKPKSPLDSRTPPETNLEPESIFVGTGVSFHGARGAGDSMNNAEADPSLAPYKLELATPQSNLNTSVAKQTTSSAGFCTYMDFAHSNVQPTESYGYPSDLSETKHV